MKTGNRKLLSLSMVLFELRNVTGNPFTHIFGVGMPTMMMILITMIGRKELPDGEMFSMFSTTVFLSIGALIPLATILMGYAVSQAQEMEKGIPQRMELFGISLKITLVNRIVAELIYMLMAFLVYSIFGVLFIDIKKPVFSGVCAYTVCTIVLAVIYFIMAHAIANFFRKFGPAYCVAMLLYFVFMIFGGLMGLEYESMPKGMRAVARLLPITYIKRDFGTVWEGEGYDFMPLIQSLLFFAALSGVMLFISLRKNRNKPKSK